LIPSDKIHKDYRALTRPNRRKKRTYWAVLYSLSFGDLKATELEKVTGMSRTARLMITEFLINSGFVTSQTNLKDRRSIIYSLTPDGRGYLRALDKEVSPEERLVLNTRDVYNAIEKEIIRTLDDFKRIFEGPVRVQASSGEERLETFFGTDPEFPRLTKEELNVIAQCLSFSLLAKSPENENVNPFKSLIEFLEAIRRVSRNKIDLNTLERIPNVVFTFELNRDLLIKLFKKRAEGGFKIGSPLN
jgi:DNA-binding MarR family transcriptional regulator